MAGMNDVELLRKLESAREKILTQIRKVIVGQENVLEQILTALLAGGHCLIVGVPGLAKTMMVATLSRIFDLRFSRIQFTPDLMPADITGTEVIEENRDTGEKSFRFVPGPLFASVLLADEINRTPPKTQSALLEAMQEHRVTVGGKTYTLEEPFFVLATQNPIEQEGTYPLPEAQLDRFMFNIWLDYPTIQDEITIVKNTTSNYQVKLEKVLTAEEIVYFQNLIRRVPVNDNVMSYAVNLAARTRPKTETAHPLATKYLSWGAGPRASQYLIVGAKTHAVLHGKYSPDIEDVKAVAHLILRHRIIRNYKAEAENITTEYLIDEFAKA